MQLPPTSFFDGTQDALPDDNEEYVDIDTESVLDQALSSWRPHRELNWHYRSRHHSLIAFSNKEFYGNRLVVFPSPAAQSARFGIEHLYVEKATYASSLNPLEAETVVKHVKQLIRLRPDSSIGVVAINQAQRDLLKDHFDREFAEDDELEEYRARWSDTLGEFFVKNLENVQGDERDIIVISTVYGPAEIGGKVAQRFGPINSKTGHRRLNVLFTRAKEKVVLVTSLRPEDILAENTAAPGVQAFKGYLEYARSGRLETGMHDTGRSPESPFEEEVIEVIRELGYQAHPQVGVAGYFIDIAVRHPLNREHFMLGIECDGATYHSAKSARDRDRLREEVLSRLHWQLHRIWSTDWFHNRDREVKRLDARIKEAVGSVA
jgi:very-short-patch-repair endonuclease